MSLTMNEQLGSVLENWLNKHDKMYRTRAYYSYFLGYGIESGGMSEAENDLAALARDYEEVFRHLEPMGMDDSDWY